MATILIEKMRAALRISSTADVITTEIQDIIEACKADLQKVGVKNIDESDPLIVRAITLYTKAEFGFNDKSEQFRKSYDILKAELSLDSDYNTAATINEVAEDGELD